MIQMEMLKMELEEFKKKYEVFRKKYNLPSFEEMNSNFDIGKIEKETGNLLKDIRVAMMEKILHYVRLLELMISPGQSSPVFMMLLKEINNMDREVMNKVFNNFVSLELESFKLDIDSSEEKEAEHIKGIIKIWKDTKGDLLKLIEIMDRNWKTGQKKNNKNYFS